MNAPVRTLRRPLQGKRLAGVCAGIARYVGVDPVVVRLGFVALTVMGGSGLLFYLVAWAVMPKAGEHDPPPAAVAPLPRATVFGVVGLLVGAALLFGTFPFGGFANGLVPLALIAGGVVLLAQRPAPEPVAPIAAGWPDPHHRWDGSGGVGPAVPPSAVDLGSWAGPVGQPSSVLDAAPAGIGGGVFDRTAPIPSAPIGSTSVESTSIGTTSIGAPVDSTVPEWASDWYRAQSEARAELGLPPLPPPGAPDHTTAAAGPSRRRRRRSGGGEVAVRRPHRWRRRLLVTMLLLVLLAVGAGALTAPIDTSVGNQNFHPLSWDAVQDRYEIGMGELIVDLRDLPPLDANRTVELHGGAGHLQLIVPASMPIELHGHAGAGQIVPPAGERESANGLGPDLDLIEPAGTPASTPRLIIRGSLGAGQLEILRR